MLSDRGLPIFTWLQQEYGVTGDALTKMVEQGQVDAQHFQAAIEQNIGGAAKNMGQSFEGSMQNLQTAMARLSANFLTSIFGGQGGDALAGPTQAVQGLTTKFDQMNAWVTSHGPQIHEFFVDVASDVKVVAEDLGHVTGFLIDHPHLVQAVAEAFVAWKSINAVSDLVSGLGLVKASLAAIPAESAAAEGSLAGLSAALGPIGVTVAAIMAARPYLEDWADKTPLHPKEAPHGFVGLNLLNLFGDHDSPSPDPSKASAAPPPPSSSNAATNLLLPLTAGAPAPAAAGIPIPGLTQTPGRAAGGLFGMMPSSAVIQPASPGLIQWAEPSTGGEAFIPINGGERSRAIWAQTGHLLGVFDQGGFNGQAAVNVAQSASGRPYGFGGTGGIGNTGLYDCSGFMSDIYAALTGRPYSGNERYFTTASDFSQLGFAEGYDPSSPFNIGVHQGGPGGGHMAGTLFGVNVESGGPADMTQFGGTAAGATDKQFDQQYHLPGNLGGLQNGGVPVYLVGVDGAATPSMTQSAGADTTAPADPLDSFLSGLSSGGGWGGLVGDAGSNFLTAPTSAGIAPSSMGPAPLGGGIGAALGTPASGIGLGDTPGPPSTGLPSSAPPAVAGGGGGGGGGGLLGAAASALPGGQAAAALASRTIQFGAQAAAIGVGGLLETFLPHDSPLAAPEKSWLGKIAGGLSGARPAAPNQAGQLPPPNPNQGGGQQHQGTGAAPGPTNGVYIQEMHNHGADGQGVARDIDRAQYATYSAGRLR